MNIGGFEFLIIVVVALIVLGPKELPKFGRTLGLAVREFRRASQGLTQELGIDELLRESPAEDKKEAEKKLLSSSS
ncbi:MAG: Sec-independent protein translocase subunit TatA/TatB [Moorellales bacterium]